MQHRRFASFLLGSAAALSGLSTVASAQDALEPEDLLRLKQVGQAAMAPGGAAVAYTVSTPANVVAGESNGTPSSALYVAMGADSGKLFVPATMGPSGIDWLDATTITFVGRADGDETRQVYQVSTSGGAPESVFAFERSIGAYAFADGGDVLFFTSRDAADPKVSALAKMGFDANIVDEDARFTRLYRVDLTDKTPIAEMIELQGNVSTFTPSADGKSVAVALAETPLVGDDIINKRFSIIDGRSGKVRATIETAGKIGAIAFSPDGTSLAFQAGVDRQDPVASTIALADARTGAFSFLTGEDLRDELDFEWLSNDSLRVLAHEGTSSVVYTLSTDGGIYDERLWDDVAIASIDGDASGYATVVHAPDHPRELFVAANGAFDRWTTLNPWLSEKTLGKQEVVTWAARDGIDVEGLLITPTGRKPKGGWPTIVLVHGGPEAHFSNGWLTRYSDPGHFGAGDGYAVFYPNYRGSTGRGQEFAKLDHKDLPAEEFNDVIDGLEALAERGIVDADRVGITGGSYGGYASAWGATAQTEHFKAAVIFVALTDLISFSGTTDIPEEMADSHFQMYPQGNWQTFLEQSPIYHAEGSQTASLILHGEADPRVHPSQSLELYRYLKRVGEAPVRLVTYPNEGHGNRRAAAQYDYSLRLMRWMDRFVKEDAETLPPMALPEIEALAD